MQTHAFWLGLMSIGWSLRYIFVQYNTIFCQWPSPYRR